MFVYGNLICVRAYSSFLSIFCLPESPQKNVATSHIHFSACASHAVVSEFNCPYFSVFIAAVD